MATYQKTGMPTPEGFETNGAWLRAVAERQGLPLRSLAQVQEGIAKCKRHKSEAKMARLMLNHGRLTDEARAWLSKEFPQ